MHHWNQHSKYLYILRNCFISFCLFLWLFSYVLCDLPDVHCPTTKKPTIALFVLAKKRKKSINCPFNILIRNRTEWKLFFVKFGRKLFWETEGLQYVKIRWPGFGCPGVYPLSEVLLAVFTEVVFNFFKCSNSTRKWTIRRRMRKSLRVRVRGTIILLFAWMSEIIVNFLFKLINNCFSNTIKLKII